jgi:Kef-type K+ transport system membrane component KefB
LFLGLSLTATSVAVSARIFRDFGRIHTAEAQIVLGAAVFDDILSLIILAVVSAIASQANLTFSSINLIIFKTFAFLTAAVFLSIFLAPHLFRFFSKIHNSVGMGFTVAISFGLIFAFFAHEIGLAPIVGAFAAGLVLEPGHFSYFENPQVVNDVKKAVDSTDDHTRKLVLNAIEPHARHNIENLFNPIGYFFIPIFFVMTGMYVKIDSMFNIQILIISLAVTVVAFAGKMVSGLAAGHYNKMLIGVGMIPRGEVGLIFAIVGKSLGVVSDAIYSVIVIMIILTTLLTPLIMTMILKDEIRGKTCTLCD